MTRLVGSLICLSAWLMLLFVGSTFGGAIHLLLLASAILFPWRSALGR